MSVKFVKYGIPYFKQIYWTPQMDGPRESDNPADNLGGLGDMGFGGGGGGMGGGSGTGGGGGFGGSGGGPGYGGGSGGGGGGAGYVPGGQVFGNLKIEQTIATDYDTQYVQVIPVGSHTQAGSPSFFHFYRNSFGVLNVTSNSGDYPGGHYDTPVGSANAGYSEGGQLVYDSLSSNSSIGGDPADGDINPTTNQAWNPDWDPAAGRWFNLNVEKAIWVKVTRDMPHKWLTAYFYASSEPFYSADQETQFINRALSFNETVAEEWLAQNTDTGSGDTGDTGNTGNNTGGNPAWSAGDELQAQYDRNVDSAPIVWNYSEPLLPLSISFPENIETPTGMLILNTTQEEQRLDITFDRAQLELNREDLKDVYETEFDEFIPDAKYLLTPEEWNEFYQANKPTHGGLLNLNLDQETDVGRG